MLVKTAVFSRTEFLCVFTQPGAVPADGGDPHLLADVPMFSPRTKMAFVLLED